MINRSALKLLLQDAPNFDVLFGNALGHPIRHAFLAAALSTFKQSGVTCPNVLEIGSWTGSSTYTLAQTLDKHYASKGNIVCIDPWEDYQDFSDTTQYFSQAYHFGLSSELVYQLFLHNISYIPQVSIQPLRGLSKNIMPLLKSESFDLIFIDGDHAYEQCLGDIRNALTLIKEGGIICGDDMELKIEECDLAFARENSHASNIQDPKTGHHFHPGVTLAVSEVFENNFSNYYGFWAVRRQGKHFHPVDLTSIPLMIPLHFPAEIQEEVHRFLKNQLYSFVT